MTVCNSRVVMGGQAGRLVKGWLKRKERRKGKVGWERRVESAQFPLAAVWCCSPCCHTSKREQIKGSSFDEYKTESPAEKHSPSLPFLITELQRRRGCANPPATHKMKGEQKTRRRVQRVHVIKTKGCFIIAINICPLQTCVRNDVCTAQREMQKTTGCYQHTAATETA